jgi:hypothetical protein
MNGDAGESIGVAFVLPERISDPLHPANVRGAIIAVLPRFWRRGDSISLTN